MDLLMRGTLYNRRSANKTIVRIAMAIGNEVTEGEVVAQYEYEDMDIGKHLQQLHSLTPKSVRCDCNSI